MTYLKIGDFWAIKQNGVYRLYSEKVHSFMDVFFDKIEYGNYEDTSDAYAPSHKGYDDYVIILNNKKGVVNNEGKIIVPCIYDNIFREGYYRTFYKVSNENKFGIYNDNGNLALECIYDSLAFIYVCMGQAVGGFAATKKGHSRICNFEGKSILDGEYDDIGILSQYHDVDFAVSKRGKYALFVCKEDLEEIVGFVTDFEFDKIYGETQDHSSGKLVKLFYFIKDGKVGVINNKGQLLLPPEYDDVTICKTKTSDMKYRFLVQSRNKYGIVQENGIINIPISYGKIDDISYYCNSVDSYAVHGENGKIAIMSFYGEIQTDYKYDEIEAYRNQDHNIIGYSFKINGLWGVMNYNCREIIQNIYDTVEPIHDERMTWYSGDYFIVSKYSKQGVVSDNGEILIPLQYDLILTESINDVFYIMVQINNCQCKAYNTKTKEYISLSTTDSHNAIKELKDIINN